MTLRRILEAPIDDLTFADFEALIREEAEEGPRLELKRALPANDRQGDPWMTGAKRFSNPARDGLAKEIVALANAYGGAVVVGVDETEDHPKRARGPDPVPIPRVAACAEQMRQALDSLIDPPLATLEVRGIERPGGDGEGVLVIRTGGSTRAPHGHGRPPLAYMRRGSHSEPMTMRDLQSVLFETRTRTERTAALLEERRRVFADLIAGGPASVTLSTGRSASADHPTVYFRCTLVATEDLGLHADELSRHGVLIRPQPEGSTAFGGGAFHTGWHPRLYGIATVDNGSRHFARWFFGDRGIVDVCGLHLCEPYRRVTDAFPPSLFPPVALQVLALGERLRRTAGRPEVELVLECEFAFSRSVTAVSGNGRAFDDGVQTPTGEVRIGPFSLGNHDDWRTVFGEVERGIWNACGLRVESHLDFPLEQWFAEMGG